MDWIERRAAKRKRTKPTKKSIYAKASKKENSAMKRNWWTGFGLYKTFWTQFLSQGKVEWSGSFPAEGKLSMWIGQISVWKAEVKWTLNRNDRKEGEVINSLAVNRGTNLFRWKERIIAQLMGDQIWSFFARAICVILRHSTFDFCTKKGWLNRPYHGWTLNNKWRWWLIKWIDVWTNQAVAINQVIVVRNLRNITSNNESLNVWINRLLKEMMR